MREKRRRNRDGRGKRAWKDFMDAVAAETRWASEELPEAKARRYLLHADLK